MIESAGTWAVERAPASQGSQLALAELGLDLRDHFSRRVNREMLRSFDLILTMEKGQKEALKVEFPEVSGRVYLLSEIVGKSHDIRDPIGMPVEMYQATASELKASLR